MTDNGPSRRKLITGLAAAGVAAPVLAACGGSSSNVTGTTGSAVGGTGGGSGGTGGGSGSGGGIKTSAIPVGGGTVFPGRQIVVTQPTAGDFKAFSAVCTHQGCLVDRVTDGVIVCPCHGSAYSIADGSVAGGPAPTPLPEKTVTVTGKTLKVT